MKSRLNARTLPGTRPTARLALVCVLASLAAGPRALSQPIVPSEPPRAVIPPSSRPAATPGVIPASGRETLLAYGPAKISVRLAERFLYAEGLRNRRGATANAYINSFSPGFAIDFGQNWSADYQATWNLYSAKGFRETLDHHARISGILRLRNWSGQLDQDYSFQTAPLIETGRQSTTETVSTRIGTGKMFNSRLSGSTAVRQELRFRGDAPNSYAWINESSLDYQLGRATTISAGIAAGYIDTDPGVNFASVQPRVRVNWSPVGGKVSGAVTFGENIIQVFSRGVSAVFTPIFDVTGSYRPFDQTELSATAGRTVSPAALRNQLVDSTRWQVSVRQRFLGTLQTTFSYGEQEGGYQATRNGVTAGRKDRGYFYTARAGTTVLRRINAGVFYNDTENKSNLAGYRLKSRQIGFDASYRF